MILCLDLETSALDEQQGGLFQIGACWLHGGEFFRDCRPREGALIEAGALAVNGRTMMDAVDPARLPEDVAVVEFLGWARGWNGCNDHIQIAAWNGHFDHRHLMAALNRAKIGQPYRPFLHRILDLHSLVAGDELRNQVGRNPDVARSNLHAFGGEVRNSDEGARRLNLEPEEKPHGALNGARKVREMLLKFLGMPAEV